MNTTDDPANLIDALAPVAAFIGIEAAVCRADPSKCSYRLVNGEGSKAGTLQVVDPATLASVVAKRFKALDVQISEETGGGRVTTVVRASPQHEYGRSGKQDRFAATCAALADSIRKGLVKP